MQINDILAQMGGFQSMARDLGVSEQQVASGAEALLPAILGGFKRQAQAQPTGLEGLGGMLGQLGGGGLLEQVLGPQATDALQEFVRAKISNGHSAPDKEPEPPAPAAARAEAMKEL